MRLFRLSPLVLLIGFFVFAGFSTTSPHSRLARADAPPQLDCEGGEAFDVPERFAEAIWPNTDFCKFVYPASQFLSGGVPRDGIPPIYPAGYIYPDTIVNYGGRPAAYTVDYWTIEETNTWLLDQSPVLVAVVNEEARAYPLGILTRHEIANTEIGGVPVAATFCPLCNTGVVFERVVDGQELHFGVSGLLRNSDLVMWDHETESWWQQATGEGVVGHYAGAQLKFVTASMVSYTEFKAAYPNGMVLAPPRIDSSYDYNPYAGYDSGDPFLYQGFFDERLRATERVLGYVTDGGERISVGYPFNLLQEQIVVNDRIGGEPVVVFWQPGATSALDGSVISDSKAVGSATMFSSVLADGTPLSFSTDGTTIKDDQTNSTWNIFGQAIEGELAGVALPQLQAVTHFWFAWTAFYPDTVLWETGTLTDDLLEARN